VAQRVEYGQPRRLNSVSLTFIVLLLGGAYWMWRFFPAYLDAWTVDHVLRESATEVYHANHMLEPDRTKEIRDILDRAKANIRKQAEINDPDLVVSASILENSATLSCEYSVRITHPLVEKTTLVHFKREEAADLRRVDWDKQ
jgi:hypothetical protein